MKGKEIATRTPSWWLEKQKTSQDPHPNSIQLSGHLLFWNLFMFCYPEYAGAFKIILFHAYFIDDRLAETTLAASEVTVQSSSYHHV